MHKSDGTAIWFEEAAEQLGVDTIRWMYLSHNPASDLRFGTRHPDQQVTIETAEGPISETKEGVPISLVTSKPADEVRRQILIPLWNSYKFFVNYARLDKFNPNEVNIPVSDCPEIDQWILSNLQALIKTARTGFSEFNSTEVCQASARFIDDLSNWYIRRNRRRFWRSQDAGDQDKMAAYQTLHTVLTTLCKVLAPAIPFLTERMYQNLVRGWDDSAPESVHLCEYPKCDDSLLDPELNARMATAQLVVKLGHKLRDDSNLRVRQPLSELKFACQAKEQFTAIEQLQDVIQEELNVKTLTGCENLDDLVSYNFKPNLKTLGPKCGKLLGVIRKELPEMDATLLAPLRNGESVKVTFNGEEIELEPQDVLISTAQAADWVCSDESGIQIAMSTQLSPELLREGMARDMIRQVQQLRKIADLEIQDRISISYHTESDELKTALTEWNDYISSETLADEIIVGSGGGYVGGEALVELKQVSIGDSKAQIDIKKL